MILLTSACIGAHGWGFYTEKMLPGSKSVDTFPFLREADGANSRSGRLITQENQSAVIRRDAAGIGGAREGRPRRSERFRIASASLEGPVLLTRKSFAFCEGFLCVFLGAHASCVRGVRNAEHAGSVRSQAGPPRSPRLCVRFLVAALLIHVSPCGTFLYQAESLTTARRVAAKVEHHAGELFPRAGFIVTNLTLPSRALVQARGEDHAAEPDLLGVTQILERERYVGGVPEPVAVIHEGAWLEVVSVVGHVKVIPDG